ncbi:hypothetical protein [Roseivivax sp. CAU 1761]
MIETQTTPIPPITPAAIAEDLPFAVNLRRVNLTVGAIAVALPVALWALGRLTGTCAAAGGLDSLSHHYYSRLGSEVFVGALWIIGALLAIFYTARAPAGSAEAGRMVRIDGYMSHTGTDIRLAKVAGLAAFAIAIFPTAGTGCPETGDMMRAFAETPAGFLDPDRDPGLAVETRLFFDFGAAFALAPGGFAHLVAAIHHLAAGVMFLILGHFAWTVFTRVQSPDALAEDGQAPTDPAGVRPRAVRLTRRKRLRNAVYRVSGAVIFAAVLALALKALLPEDLRAGWDRRNLTFWAETAALWAFGASWLVKGRFVSWLTDPPGPDRRIRAAPKA